MPGDSLALDVCRKLRTRMKQFDFIECETLDELIAVAAQKSVRDPIILDVVQGLRRARLVQDLSELAVGTPSSLHDFDAGFFLRVAREGGVFDRVVIIGLPPALCVEKAVAEAQRLLAVL